MSSDGRSSPTLNQQPPTNPNERGVQAVGRRPLTGFEARKIDRLVAITTPIPDSRGNISKRTPIYHLPVYGVALALGDSEHKLEIKCDLADMTDLMAKLRELKNQWETS